jgi:hypothetical protein
MRALTLQQEHTLICHSDPVRRGLVFLFLLTSRTDRKRDVGFPMTLRVGDGHTLSAELWG